MNSERFARTVRGLLALFLLALAGTLVRSRLVLAQNQESDWKNHDDESDLVRIGFEIAPVPLNLEGKNRNLVGLGSFIVNAQGDCNGCHTGGLVPNFNYANGGNPYFLNPGPTKTDPSVYLSGGTDFGPAVFPSPPGGFPFYPWATAPIPASYPPAEYGGYVGPNIITRNLTPDRTGLPEGGRTLVQFKQILRTGIDLDNLHPTCTSAVPVPTPANCIPPPVDGSRLQVMPWPVFHNMTDHQIEAIYEFLKTIPCISGPQSPADVAAVDPNAAYAFAQLHNDCGDPPMNRAAAVLSRGGAQLSAGRLAGGR